MPCTMRWRRWASRMSKCPPPRSTCGNRSKAPNTRPPSNRRKLKMYDFAYHRPKSLADAVSLLKGKPEGRVMSGGMTLIPTLKQRLAKPSDVVDLAGVKELAGTKVEGTNLVIAARHRPPPAPTPPPPNPAI